MTWLASGLLITAMLRRANDSGGFGAVLARGDPDSGAILVVVSQPGQPPQCVESGYDARGKPALIATGPVGESEAEAYWQRRRERDRDLWVVALDGADAKRFAAETILAD